MVKHFVVFYLVLIFLVVNTVYSQNSSFAIKEYPTSISENYGLKNELPDSVNNSNSPYFPPIYSQTNPVCNQVAVGYYMMTYERNARADLNSFLPENQMSVYYPWNFSNGGNGWYGVSFIQSLDLLKKQGIPSASVFGEDKYRDSVKWMSGYEKYYSGMFNRIKEYYSIDMHNLEGIEKMKSWLYNHIGTESFGGLAVFMAQEVRNDYLPIESTHYGELVFTAWGNNATHTRTIVGYNDSICFDSNGDGIFTTDVDINNDGIVDLKDSEYGAFRCIETYGETWGDSGFYWVMYNTFAENYSDGGVLNNRAFVIEPNMDYSPLLTAKINLNNDKRNQLQIGFTLFTGENLDEEQRTFYFPIVNYQGEARPMQGHYVAEDESFEYGLDLTEILSYVESGEKFRLALVVDVADSGNPGDGDIEGFAVYDYSGSDVKDYENFQTISIINYIENPLFVDLSVEFDKLEIISELSIDSCEYFQYQLEAIGGEPVYEWDIVRSWDVNTIVNGETFVISGQKISPDEEFEGVIDVDLPFDFPFGNSKCSKVKVSSQGFVVPDDELAMVPYFRDNVMSMLESYPVIAVMPREKLTLYPDRNDGIWMDSTSSSVTFYWDVSQKNKEDWRDAKFSTTLYEDGGIVCHYGEYSLTNTIRKLFGVSLGDQSSYRIFDEDKYPDNGTIVEFVPHAISEDISLNCSGLLSGIIESMENSHLKIRVGDSNGQYQVKEFLNGDNDTEIIPLIGICIYPNPTGNRFYLHSEDSQEYNVSIINSLGYIVIEKLMFDGDYLNVSNLDKALYLVRILSKDNSTVYLPLIKI